MITAAMQGALDAVRFTPHAVFGLLMPENCPDVPSEILDPRNTWADKTSYDAKAKDLAVAFNKNFEKYADKCSPEILDAAPRV